jgi:hypothetical protein
MGNSAFQHLEVDQSVIDKKIVGLQQEYYLSV